jgi:8-oxo-dGTP pyrophosphatase MutT (NUDIX family)
MTGSKVCPVVLRQRSAIQLLAFRHPIAGLQLVKGSIEAGEGIEAAAIRELREEAGIADGRASGGYGSGLIAGTPWHFVRISTPELPDAWIHHCADDGGHAFAFFWHPLADEADPGLWHQHFMTALIFVRSAVGV